MDQKSSKDILFIHEHFMMCIVPWMPHHVTWMMGTN